MDARAGGGSAQIGSSRGEVAETTASDGLNLYQLNPSMGQQKQSIHSPLGAAAAQT